MKSSGAQNPNEVFSIVDSNDKVVGSACRLYIHANSLRHRSVHAIVLSKDGGKILLQRRSALKDSYPLRYTTSVSGHVDRGESYENALVRETFEEIGLRVNIQDFTYLGRIGASEDTGWEFARVYVLHSDGPFKFPPEEIDSLDWAALSDFDASCSADPGSYTPAFLSVYKYFKKFYNKGI